MNISEIIKRNPTLISTKNKARALFSDVYQNDSPRINVLIMAYEYGIIEKMSSVDAFSKAKLISDLTSRYAVRDDVAAWAIDVWDSILSPEVIKALSEIEDNQISEVEPDTIDTFETSISDDLDIHAIKEEYEDYYVNPCRKVDSRIYIPCGFGNTDNGFLIHGIKRADRCTHINADVFALIYNYLIRNSKMDEEDIPECIQKMETTFSIDYRSIYRITITILQLIRHNYISGNKIALDYDGDINDIKGALSIINNYAKLFCTIMQIEPVRITASNGKGGIKISQINTSGIYIENNKDIVSNAREIWYGRKINYKINIDNKVIVSALEYILREISPFHSFKEGQLPALAEMISNKRHSICIMPTGSGKSLIYYMASLLQPLPIFVVSPTDILIRDQIRNLGKFHRIDNAAHLKLTEENNFYNYNIQCSINFLTPMTLQNNNLFRAFRHINNGTEFIVAGRGRDGAMMKEVKRSSGALASYIVLDEIHCISNWGHDFRPEYLMLSQQLNRLLDRVTLWGFTATANYTVVEDIQKQLSIEENCIYSPITYDKYNVSYVFKREKNTQDMYSRLSEIIEPIVKKGERTLVFTKDSLTAAKVADTIGYEADLFYSDDPSSYYQFVENKCSILVATDDLGIGINLPNVKNVVHFGLPLSKNEYIQEIGRAGRENGRVKSIVIYLEASEDNVPEKLLRRDTPISDVSELLPRVKNDYSLAFNKFTNGCPTQDVLYQKLLSFYGELKTRPVHVMHFNTKEVEEKKQLLYMLYITGYVHNWYTNQIISSDDLTRLYIDICSTGAEKYEKDPSKMINRMKQQMRDYFEFLGNNRESIVKIGRAKSIEELFHLYIEWYYNNYLYHYREQFFDYYDFIERNLSGDTYAIVEEIQDFFTLPFAQIKLDEAYYTNLSMEEICNKAIIGISRRNLVNIERINSNQYSYKLDFLIFFENLKNLKQFDESRLARVMESIQPSEGLSIIRALEEAYPLCDTESRLMLIGYIEKHSDILQMSATQYISKVYRNTPKDIVYYGILAKAINPLFN